MKWNHCRRQDEKKSSQEIKVVINLPSEAEKGKLHFGDEPVKVRTSWKLAAKVTVL